MAAAIYSLYIINKSGGLIFFKDYGSAGRRDTNDTLRVARLWHSIHAISQQLSPVLGCSGIEMLKAETFDLHCFQSLTGNKSRIQSFDENGICYISTSDIRHGILHVFSSFTRYHKALKDLYTHLTPIQRVNIARHPNRPTFLDHIFNITEKFVELHGDRQGYDVLAIVTGIGTIDGRNGMGTRGAPRSL